MVNTHTTLASLFTDIANKIRAKKGTSASIKADDFPSEIESIQTGITPSGTISITTTSPVDVTNYATAQVVDADLVASNIKKDVNILGVLGTFEGGGGGPAIAWGEVTPTNQTSMTITLPWVVGSNDDVILVIIASVDPRNAYSTLTLENRTGEFAGRSYNGSLTTADKNRSFIFTFNNNEVTITKNPSTGAYNLNATSYYWFAISPIANPVMFTMP